MHPPDDNKLLVAAFKVPVEDNYMVSRLGLRRVDNEGSAVCFKVFNQRNVFLSNMQATNSCARVTDSNTYSLGKVNPGDGIYFAAERDGDFGWDATEIAFTVTATVAN
jgi:succinate dehydrogenase/fumarate reductase flavoprotein subunit